MDAERRGIPNAIVTGPPLAQELGAGAKGVAHLPDLLGGLTCGG